MRLNLRRKVADTLTVPPSGERRLSLGLLALPVLVLDVVCAFGVAAANHGTARTVLLAILGLCLVLTLVSLTVGPGLIRNATDVPSDAYRPTGPIRSTPVLIMPDTPLPVPTPVAPAAQSAPAPLAPASELIVAAARRHQTLVQRQRTVVADLAGGEKRALEQLTERMRRQGDSLMIIAGVEPDRPVHSPMALSEVIATAAGEIESSERVSWSLAVDQFVQPHLVPPLVHLLAELLENATGYAFPAGGVQIFVQPSVDGVRLRIEDSGPGFSDSDLERANQRLRDPDAEVEEVGSLGFGLFVAGRLAQDVPCSIEMTRADSGGVSVLVDLPRSVFGTAPEASHSADYSHYDDATDLPEYAEMQGYGDIPTSDPLPGEPTLAAEPVTSPWQAPVVPASGAWSTEPAIVPDPVASAGQMSLDEPFGANAPLPMSAEGKLPQPREEGIPVPQTFFNPIEPKIPEAAAAVSAPVGTVSEPASSADVSWNPSWDARGEDSDGEVGFDPRWNVAPRVEEVAGDVGENVAESPGTDAREDVSSEPRWDVGEEAGVEGVSGSPAVNLAPDSTTGARTRREARADSRAAAGDSAWEDDRGAAGSAWESLPGVGAEQALDPLAASGSPWADPRTDALTDPLTDPLTDALTSPEKGAEDGPAETFSDPISHPPHEEHPVAVPAETAAVPKQYPSRAELRRRRRALEAENETAMQAGAQAAAQVAAAQSAGPETAAPADSEEVEDWAAAARAEDRDILGQVEEWEAERPSTHFPAASGGDVPAGAAPGVPHQVSPLDDPNFRFDDGPDNPDDSAESPAIPAQAGAPEDAPAFEETPGEPTASSRHAASGPIPMVSANRSSLAGPNDAPRQRATQVRSMLSGLRSGAEKGRREATENTEGDAGVPRPRHSDRPEQ